MAFWSAVLLYISPTRRVPLHLLNASAESNAGNLERIFAEYELTEKGVYLPPKNLKTLESSLIFVPKEPQAKFPAAEETNEKLFSEQKNGVFLTPPGLSLSQLFEKTLGYSFASIDLERLCSVLPRLLKEGLDLVEGIQIQAQGGMVNVEVTDSVFSELCLEEANNQPRTHAQVGCLLSSAIACALAKASGKGVIIEKEVLTLENTSKIEYRLQEL